MLRPALGQGPLLPPQPPAVRRVWCPDCGHVFHASAKALSLRCPRCTHALAPSDYQVTGSLRGDLTVIGRVDIPSQMRMQGRLICGEFTNQGQFIGQARVGGPVELTAESQTRGAIACHSLRMAPGAKLRAKAAIGSMDEPPPRASLSMGSRPRAIGPSEDYHA
ncbi:MAG: polymer-forming cytoskeletal protein [Phycisphaeraceae bacterium]|nr:polymer-forming cytoskeletal protein [Phycisphaeraceae bacterium]